MSKLDKRALATALIMTGSVLLGSLIGTLLVKYASPMFTMAFMVTLLVVFFYFIFKD